MSEEQDIPRHVRKQDRVYTGLADYRVQRPGAPQGTFWRGGTETMRARFFVGPLGSDPRSRREMITWSGFYSVEIKPDEVVELPSEWDGAVQVVSSAGIIVSGRLPKARRVAAPDSGLPDPPAPELHPALAGPGASPARRRRRPGGEP